MIEVRKQICRDCTDRPEGCWKAEEYGCSRCFREAQDKAAETGDCPLSKLRGVQLDLRTISGFVYTAPHRHVQLQDTHQLEVIQGPHFGRNFRVHVARHWGELLQDRKPPFALFEDDCLERQPLGTIWYPPDSDMLMLGGGNRGGGRAQRNILAKQAFGYSYEDWDINWMRVWGMLYNHAMVFITDRALEMVGEAFRNANRPGDQLTAALQHQLVVYCLKEPLLIQRNNDQTWNYGPQHVVIGPKRHEIVRQLRAGRRMALGVG